MDPARRRNTLVVANRTATTPRLLQEIDRRAAERPTAFTLLIPDVTSKKAADWTLESALKICRDAARGPEGLRPARVEGLVGGPDPFESIKQALVGGSYDEVIISTLPKRTSEWLRRDLPRRVKRLKVPVTVMTQPEEDPSGIGAFPVVG